MARFLQTALSTAWTFARRPRVFFASLVENPPLGAALFWLALLGLLSGLSGLHAGLQGKTSFGQDWWREMPVAKAVAGAVGSCVIDMFWATLLTWLLARMVRETMRLDALYTVLAFATIPYALTTLAFPLRNVSYLSYHIWQGVHLVVMGWASVLVCVGVQSCLGVRMSRAIQCALPALVILWSLGWRAHHAVPTSFRAACPWQHIEGETVRVYYPPGKSEAEVSAIARGLDSVMQKDCAVLNIKPLPFKVNVFCFADDDLQRRLAGADEEPDNTAHTFWDCVTISYTTWKQMDNQMAHELCHVLLTSRLTDKVSGLLDEGLCEYVAHKVAPGKDDQTPYAASFIPLRTLARADVFFDWEQARDVDDSEWTHYTTGESLVTYLIQRHGVEKFKKFYGRVARYTHPKDVDEEPGKPLARAVQEVYGLSLLQLEAQWRHACPPPNSSHSSVSHSSTDDDDKN